MKNKVSMFLCVVVFFLTIVPAINLRLGTHKEGYKQWSKTVLFSFDFALPYLSRILYPMGISIDPSQVVIGKEDWLYLGDQYRNTLTASRQGTMLDDVKTITQIRLATKSWEQWLKHKGVSLFRVIICPNKSTIYPEFLPEWAVYSGGSASKKLTNDDSQEYYIDTKSPLILAKSQFSELLYYKNDTHWNELGAWVAYRAFALNVARTEVGLNWLNDKQIYVSKTGEHRNGDLAKFLWLSEMLQNNQVAIKIISDPPIEIEQYDFETGLPKILGGNPEINTPKTPLLVKSKHALNNKKLLWLRDSFGEALSPFIAATFSETLQIHYDMVKLEYFKLLVETYNPDYVLITAVERQVAGKWFIDFPLL